MTRTPALHSTSYRRWRARVPGFSCWSLARRAAGALAVLATCSFFAAQSPTVSGAEPMKASGPPPAGIGYRLAAADGGVFAFGGAGFFGSMASQPLNVPVVGIASPDTNGYWLVAGDGGIFAFGDARYLGSMASQPLTQPVVGVVNKFEPTPGSGGVPPSGNGAPQGYWEVARDGGVFAFGTAGFYGSLAGVTLSAPIQGMATTFDGAGYWLVGQDGAIYAFGDAAFPVAGYSGPPLPFTSGAPSGEVMVAMTHFGMDNSSILTVSNLDRVFPYLSGSARPPVQLAPPGAPSSSIVGLSATISPIGDAYVVTTAGNVISYNGAPLFGSMAGLPLAAPVVAIDGY